MWTFMFEHDFVFFHSILIKLLLCFVYLNIILKAITYVQKKAQSNFVELKHNLVY